MMSFKEYKEYLDMYSDWVEGKILTKGNDRIFENTLGLVGEAGEVAEKVKKMLRDKARYSNEDLLHELGDVLFYTTALANIYGGTLKSIIELNMEKLDGRMERGTLRGSGDKR
jgi:NTP pyrophosphatase (non-canonical NTP hydrolase)